MIDERKQQFVALMIRKSEIDFNDYYREKEELFTGVARTYGTKQARKMRDEHKKEFTETSKKNAQNRKTKLVEMTNEIEQLDQFIEENKKLVENNILPNLKALHSNIEKFNNEIID